MVTPVIACSKCLNASSNIVRDMDTDEVYCEKCAEKLKQQGKRLIPLAHTHCDRAKELVDVLKEAKYALTTGYELWLQHEGKDLAWAEKHAEQEKRLEAYVKLRIEQATIS